MSMTLPRMATSGTASSCVSSRTAGLLCRHQDMGAKPLLHFAERCVHSRCGRPRMLYGCTIMHGPGNTLYRKCFMAPLCRKCFLAPRSSCFWAPESLEGGETPKPCRRDVQRRVPFEGRVATVPARTPRVVINIQPAPKHLEIPRKPCIRGLGRGGRHEMNE